MKIRADSLVAAYVDALPLLDRQPSSRQWYNQMKASLGSKVSVTHFNQVRFLAKFRQLEMDDESDYQLCFKEMKTFNDLS